MKKLCLLLNLLQPISKSVNYSTFWAKRRWKLKYLKGRGVRSGKKMDCACAPVARGRRISDVCLSIGVSRAQLSIRVHRLSDWQDHRRQPRFDDNAVLSRINTAVASLPAYGYRRVWALLRRESERDGKPVVNAKRVYRIMNTHHLLLERKPADKHRKRAHKRRVAVAESNRPWCSDGFEFRCDNGEKLRVTFAQDCCDQEITTSTY